jgi:hypothetical protein
VWEMLTFYVDLGCVGFITFIGIVAVIRRQRLALSVGPN